MAGKYRREASKEILKKEDLKQARKQRRKAATKAVIKGLTFRPRAAEVHSIERIKAHGEVMKVKQERPKGKARRKAIKEKTEELKGRVKNAETPVEGLEALAPPETRGESRELPPLPGSETPEREKEVGF